MVGRKNEHGSTERKVYGLLLLTAATATTGERPEELLKWFVPRTTSPTIPTFVHDQNGGNDIAPTTYMVLFGRRSARFVPPERRTHATVPDGIAHMNDAHGTVWWRFAVLRITTPSGTPVKQKRTHPWKSKRCLWHTYLSTP